jgi:hypothetical protein
MRTKLENYLLEHIEWTEDGNSIELLISKINAPGKNLNGLCQNIVLLHMHRTIPDTVPYYIGELTWRSLTDEEKRRRLKELRYSNLNRDGDVYYDSKVNLIEIHIEGGINMDIICEKFSLDDIT